ncbi:hypothetical protein [Candidatus Neomicrothrix sp.]|uniref:hypothetical protein n=1 Tax=Candidatus Neomicrothrix sp. TaxID=2719034 RepID=UPI0025980C2B|nr:hypothetical protein [Candidatus Microthrix sp.]HMS49719.1 hypothetical protein [Candidatus Microthrix sp.]HMT26561.1 hypothetical protein [Microthrixaceae bacterium]
MPAGSSARDTKVVLDPATTNYLIRAYVTPLDSSRSVRRKAEDLEAGLSGRSTAGYSRVEMADFDFGDANGRSFPAVWWEYDHDVDGIRLRSINILFDTANLSIGFVTRTPVGVADGYGTLFEQVRQSVEVR